MTGLRTASTSYTVGAATVSRSTHGLFLRPPMPRPRLFYILGSLEANDTGEEIITILGRLSRAQFEPRVVALGGHEDLQGRIVDDERCVLTRSGSRV